MPSSVSIVKSPVGRRASLRVVGVGTVAVLVAAALSPIGPAAGAEPAKGGKTEVGISHRVLPEVPSAQYPVDCQPMSGGRLGPRRIKRSGWTVLLDADCFTNAGQRVEVRVSGRYLSNGTRSAGTWWRLAVKAGRYLFKIVKEHYQEERRAQLTVEFTAPAVPMSPGIQSSHPYDRFEQIRRYQR